MFFKFDPEREVAQLKAAFEEDKAAIWADESMPLADKGPAVEQLWREFHAQRTEIRNAYQGEATEQEGLESPQGSRAPIFPRRKRPSWK
jgi:hypothetical protein